MTSQKPFLIYGGDFIAFIEKKKTRARNRLKPGEFRCLSCGHIGAPLAGWRTSTNAGSDPD